MWDAEDIYGANAVWKALKAKDTRGDMVRLSVGPWYHGQEIEEGSSLGAVKFGQDTALWWRKHVLAPLLAHYLKDGAPPMDIATATVFETGTNEWRTFSTWPVAAKPTPLYLRPNLGLDSRRPAGRQARSAMSPIRPSPCPTARGRCPPRATTPVRNGRAG